MNILEMAMAAKMAGGGVSSWNDLTDKPFYEETTTVQGDTLTWDGNTEGLETADVVLFGMSAKLARVSKAFAPISDIAEISSLIMQADTESMDVLSMCALTVGEHGYTVGMAGMEGEYVVGSDGAHACSNGEVLSEGVWVISVDVEGAKQFVSELTIPGYTGFVTAETVVQTIDPKFLPEGVPYVEKKYGVILPETTAEINADNNNMAMLPDRLNISVGQAYDVSWNGTKYTCVAQLFASGDGAEPQVVLGNIGFMAGGDSTGEPFIIFVVDAVQAAIYGVGCMIVAFDGSTSVTVSIVGEAEIIHTIDPKCLPSGENFDLITLGLSEVTGGGETMSIECDTTDIRAAMSVGTVRVFVNLNQVYDSPSTSIGGHFIIPVNAVQEAGGAYHACVPITPYCRFYMKVDANAISVTLTADK